MSIYKDCDIRGIYGEEFDKEDAYLIGKAVGTLHRGKTLVVGGDVRLSTPVLDAEFFHAAAPQGGIMVTASHNPARYNGFKMMFGNAPVTAEEIKKVEELVHLKNFCTGIGSYGTRRIDGEYAVFIEKHCRKGRLKIVLDCCDGAASKIVPDIMEKMGYEVIPLYCGSDGNFPNRNPNPAEYECLADVCKKVLETGADLGAAYDGDGDRVVFIDNRGRYLTSEKSFAIFIRHYLKAETGSFVYDQKSASLVKNTILAYGGTPIVERSGYGFIKQRFLEAESLAAGEISGHFFFHEIGRDDGLYATLKMCEIIESDGRSLAQMDGVRIEFRDGWFLLRKSVTEQAMTFRIEASDKEALGRIKEVVEKAVPEIKEALPE